MRVVIVGMSEIGITLANSLSSRGHKVSVIEDDSEKLKSVARITDAQIFEGDGADIDILKDAKINDSDAIITCTNDDRTNLMACLVAGTMKVPKIISLVNHSKNESLFTKHGIIVVPEVTNVARGLELLLYRRYSETILATVGKGMIIKVQVGEKSPMVDKPSKLKAKGIIGMIQRDEELIIPENENKVQAGDILIITCLSDQIEDILKEVIGE